MSALCTIPQLTVSHLCDIRPFWIERVTLTFVIECEGKKETKNFTRRKLKRRLFYKDHIGI